MADEIRRAQDCRSEDASPDSQMAEGGSVGERSMVGDEGGYAARGRGIATARQRVSSLCLGPVGESVAKTSRQRRLYSRPLRGRLCRGVPAQARCRAIPDRAEVPNGAVRFKLAS